MNIREESKINILKVDKRRFEIAMETLGVNYNDLARMLEFNVNQSIYKYGGVRKTVFLALKYATKSELWDETLIDENYTIKERLNQMSKDELIARLLENKLVSYVSQQ